MNLRYLSMEEKKMIYQLDELLKGPALQACRANFECKILMGKKLQDFLDDRNNKHPLFHQHYPKTPCCLCIGGLSMAATGRKGKLTHQQFQLIFDDSGTPVSNHELMSGNNVKQFCLCKISVKKTLSVSSLDITLINVIDRHCKSPNRLNQACLEGIRKVRNYLCHANTNCITKTTFDNHWKTLETAAIGFASEVGETFLLIIREQINEKKKIGPTNDVEKNKEDSVEWKRLSKKIEENAETTNKKLEQIREDILGELRGSSGLIKEKIEIRYSDKSKQTLEKTDSVIPGISLEAKVDGPFPNENEAIDRLQNGICDNDGEQFKLNYAGRGCLLLKITSNREIFKNEESLYFAIRSLKERILKAGEINTSTEGTIKMVLTLTSPITIEERKVLCGMLLKFGVLNETRFYPSYHEDEESNLTVSQDSDVSENFDLTEEHSKSRYKEDNSYYENDGLQGEVQSVDDLSPRIHTENPNVTTSYDKGENSLQSETENITEKGDFARRNEDDRKADDELSRIVINSDLSTEYEIKDLSQSKSKMDDPLDTTLNIPRDADFVTDKQEVICLDIDNITCTVKLKGISFNKEPTPETDNEDTALYLVEWLLDCPNTWDILAIVRTMNDNLYIKSQLIIWSSDEEEHQLIVRTITKSHVFNSSSSVELDVRAFVSNIVNECNLQAGIGEVLFITAVVMVCLKDEKVKEEDGSDAIEIKGLQSSALPDNIVACIHCCKQFECIKCMKKEEKIMQLSKELNNNLRKEDKVKILLDKNDDEISKENEADNVHSTNSSERPAISTFCNNYFLSSIILFILVLLLGLFTSYLYELHLQSTNMSRVITPVDLPKINAQNSTMPHVNPQLYWGTYRANLYFGMKTRSPRSPVVGLMWFDEIPGEKKRPIPSLRHWCKSNDSVVRYGWKKHDGKKFGIQKIVDTNFILTTSFIKRFRKNPGGDWSWRISVMPKNRTLAGVVSLLVYVALEDDGKLDPIMENGRIKYIDGSSAELGDFVFTFPSAKKTNTVKYSRFVAQHTGFTRLEDDFLNNMHGVSWNNTHFFTAFGDRKSMTVSKVNMIVHQVTGELPIEIDVVYETGKFTNNPNPNSMKDDVLTLALNQASEKFDDRFASIFKLKDKGFQVKYIDFAKSAISNLLGEISYFYGSSRVISEYNKRYDKDPLNYWPAALYTSIPSRTSFPRGFLWNVGFDNLLISLWDPKITEDIIAHWLDLLNNEGWIPREQILGEEAKAQCPDKFIVQDNKNANPPTFFITLKYLMRRGLTNRQFLEKIFPRLKVMFHWLNTSQSGESPTTYYWRGRHYETSKQINPLTPSSGFDDYPRANRPNSKERHLDLRCWMALASGAMADIGKKIKKEWKIYEDMHQLLVDNDILDKYHWSSLKGMYSDVGIHQRNKKSEPKLIFVTFFGYSSLFPLMLRIIDPDSERLTKMLTDIKRKELLWTDFGLRSLAQNSSFYRLRNTVNDPPYWRGSIWINMNYLTLSGLYHYRTTAGKNQQLASDIYYELRNNIVSNVFKEYNERGSIFEQYDDQTGKGKGSHPFAGWSALIVAIMAEEY